MIKRKEQELLHEAYYKDKLYNEGVIVLNELNNIFLDKVSVVVEEARKNVKTAVNIMMVYTYFEIGRMIVEEEQSGSNRAELIY